MVDPLTDTVLAKAHTSTDHLLQHAVMKCIDLIAELQGGGAWSRKKDVAMPQNKPGSNFAFIIQTDLPLKSKYTCSLSR